MDKETFEKLLEPFPVEKVQFLPKGKAYNDRIMVLAFIDARMVMDRLDEVIGPGNWYFDWEPVDDKKGRTVVAGNLTIQNIWDDKNYTFVSHQDVGEAAEEEEPWKAAVSDALKRCAVHVGIGRYLYDLPQFWVESKTNSRGKDVVKDPEEPRRLLAQYLKTGEVPKIPKKPKEEKKEGFGTPPGEFHCADCGNPITEKVASYSEKEYGRRLCMPCQKEEKEACARPRSPAA